MADPSQGPTMKAQIPQSVMQESLRNAPPAMPWNVFSNEWLLGHRGIDPVDWLEQSGTLDKLAKLLVQEAGDEAAVEAGDEADGETTIVELNGINLRFNQQDPLATGAPPGSDRYASRCLVFEVPAVSIQVGRGPAAGEPRWEPPKFDLAIALLREAVQPTQPVDITLTNRIGAASDPLAERASRLSSSILRAAVRTSVPSATQFRVRLEQGPWSQHTV
jgi:hypothetical protein